MKAGFRRDVVYNHAWQGAVYGVQWPLGKLSHKSSQQCRKSSLCTVSYDTTHDTITLEICWLRKGKRQRRRCVCVCVCVSPICIIQLSTSLVFSFSFSYITFISIPTSCILPVSVLSVETSPVTHIRTPLLGHTPSVTQPTPSNRQRTLYPDFDPSMRHKRN
jgi:hypothetical protein